MVEWRVLDSLEEMAGKSKVRRFFCAPLYII